MEVKHILISEISLTGNHDVLDSLILSMEDDSTFHAFGEIHPAIHVTFECQPKADRDPYHQKHELACWLVLLSLKHHGCQHLEQMRPFEVM